MIRISLNNPVFDFAADCCLESQIASGRSPQEIARDLFGGITRFLGFSYAEALSPSSVRANIAAQFFEADASLPIEFEGTAFGRLRSRWFQYKDSIEENVDR